MGEGGGLCVHVYLVTHVVTADALSAPQTLLVITTLPHASIYCGCHGF